MIRIELAGEPVGKGRPRFVKATGRAFTPERTARFEDRLAWAAQAVVRGAPLLTGALRVTIYAYKTIPASWSQKKRAEAAAGRVRPVGKPDADNFAKCADACNRIVWVDDAQIVELHVYKWYSDRPRMEILIEET